MCYWAANMNRLHLPLLRHFCWFTKSPGRNRKRVEEPKSKSTQAYYLTRCPSLYRKRIIAEKVGTAFWDSNLEHETLRTIFIKQLWLAMSWNGNEASMWPRPDSRHAQRPYITQMIKISSPDQEHYQVCGCLVKTVYVLSHGLMTRTTLLPWYPDIVTFVTMAMGRNGEKQLIHGKLVFLLLLRREFVKQLLYRCWVLSLKCTHFTFSVVQINVVKGCMN